MIVHLPRLKESQFIETVKFNNTLSPSSLQWNNFDLQRPMNVVSSDLLVNWDVTFTG